MRSAAKRIYIIAGEASGDLHGGNLAKALLLQQPDLVLRGWGGDKLREAGVEVVKDYRDLAFMGFIEVVKNLGTIRANFAFAHADIEAFQPDVVVLVDYPGFNLRLAKWLNAKGITVYYYISPQLWAWNRKRVKKMHAYVDELYVILPFEVDFYAEYGIEAHYFGHPLMDVIDGGGALKADEPSGQRTSVALLPGSRKQEIERTLTIQLEVAKRLPDFDFIVAGAPGQEPSFYTAFIDQYGGLKNVIFTHGATYAVLASADAAVVTSGTATLETALFGVPQIVVYKGSSFSYQIAKRLIKVKYISLVNLLLNRPLVAELIQQDCTVERVTDELIRLFEPSIKTNLQAGYTELRRQLGSPGVATRIAEHMLQKMNSSD